MAEVDSKVHPLPADKLIARCNPGSLGFDTTDSLAEWHHGLGQGRAEEALRFALAMRQPGYHVFVLGEPGSGRHATVRRVVDELAAKRPVPQDLCYVHNFDDPLRPRLLRLPAGLGAALHHDMQMLLRDIGPAVDAALDAEGHSGRVEALHEAHKLREETALREIGQASAEVQLSLLRTPEGYVFAPVREDEPMTPDVYEALPKNDREAIEENVKRFSDQLGDLLDKFPGWRRELREALNRAVVEALTPAVKDLLGPLEARYDDNPDISRFLAAVRRDLLETGADWQSPGEDEETVEDDENAIRFHRYQVNLLVHNGKLDGAPVVCEDNPGFGNLIGRVEHIAQMGTMVTNYNLIRAGALHHANGGYLILDANRLFQQPYAWEGVKRALRARRILIEPPAEAQGWSNTLTLEPEAAPCDVKVVLIGERETFYLLNEHDPDFPELFKVAADFDDDIERTPNNERHFARLMGSVARASGLLSFDAPAVASLIEQSARMAEDAHRLSLSTRVLADMMRESDYVARQRGATRVGRSDVLNAMAARRRRFDRYPTRVRAAALDGTVLISTTGAQAGQINGLVVIELAGELFGHPMRITATVHLGEGDVVDIERETELGGALHSKGVLIIASFLAARYARHQPLSVAASLVFEQSYSPVEGDSASLAELCALLSALSDVPIRQGLAVTGSINQFGAVQAIGGVNEKIEGFFELCEARGLTGEQGVVIPASNVRHLMLRDDVLAAAQRGQFHVYAVDNVDQAMNVLTGTPAGAADRKGNMPRGTINHRVAETLARMSAARHAANNGEPRRSHARRNDHR